MKKIYVFIILVFTMCFGTKFSIQASQSYSLPLYDNFDDYSQCGFIKNVQPNTRTYITFSIGKDKGGCRYFKIYQKINNKKTAKKSLKLKLQKKVDGKWIDIKSSILYANKKKTYYLGELVYYIEPGEYRYSFKPTYNRIKYKYYGEEFIIDNTGNKKSKAKPLIEYIYQINLSKTKCREFDKGTHIRITPSSKANWSYFNLKKTQKLPIGIEGKVYLGKIKCTIYNSKNKKVYSKIFSIKNKYGLIINKKLKKGKYYIKITKIKKHTAGIISLAMNTKNSVMFKKTQKRDLKEEKEKLSEYEEIADYYDDDWKHWGNE